MNRYPACAVDYSMQHAPREPNLEQIKTHSKKVMDM
jgi:hypothetical protein